MGTVRPSYDAETQAWIDAAETKTERKKRQQRAKYERHGHKYRVRHKEQYDEDPRKILDRNAKWAADHPEKTAEWKLAWEKKFKEEHPEEHRARRRAIDERRKDKTAEYGKKWREENPHLSAKKQAAYKARKMQATVAWANDFFIEEDYALAQLRTEMTGFKWEVDHIVPLMNDKVCGLHVGNNLRVIPEIHNRRKHAQFGDGIPTEHLWPSQLRKLSVARGAND